MPVAAPIMEALQEANRGTASAYAEDRWSQRLDAAFSELFETPTLALPLATGSLRFGSTHEHHQLDNQPTNAGRQQLLDGLGQLLCNSNDFRVTAHQAGVRPATRDRQPLLGTHPEHRNLHIFNGFGARGTLTIPWHARRFARYLRDELPLPEASDIGRFKS